MGSDKSQCIPFLFSSTVNRANYHSLLDQWNWQTIVIGVSFLAFLLVAKFIVRIKISTDNYVTIMVDLMPIIIAFCLPFIVEQGKKNKKYFWVPAIAPMISIILSTLFVFIFHAEKHGVQIVSSFTLS